MGVFNGIFKSVPDDSVLVTHWRKIKEQPVIGAAEKEAISELQKLGASLSRTRHELVRQPLLRKAAMEQKAFTFSPAFNTVAKPKSLRGLEVALGEGKEFFDTYASAIPEIDTVAEEARKIQQRLEQGEKLRDVRKDIFRVNDAAFDVTLRLARVQEAVKNNPDAANDAPVFTPFGFGQRVRVLGFAA